MLSSRSARNISGVFVVVMSYLMTVSFPFQASEVSVGSAGGLWGTVGEVALHDGSEGVGRLIEVVSLCDERAILA